MIKVRISDDALSDLTEGFQFYEAQEAGLGDYFAACLKADIECLKVTGGIHRKPYGDIIIGPSAVSFLMRFTTRLRRAS